jgi:hypothetical protein
MAGQPFTMQTPEYIAKFYGGDIQKIFKALQSGALKSFAPAPFDQTLAAAAADFIKQIRAAAQTEQAPQQTVFDKLFAPPAPQQPPAGLGATPQAAPMPPQEMGPPPQEMGPPPQEMAPPQDMPSMAEGGMVPPYASGGGLSDVPIPDGMFDEPSNGGFGDGYAGGGMVAFGNGGGVDLERLRKAIIAQESGGDYGVMNAEGSGAMGAYQFMPPTARALAERLGLPYRPELLQGSKGRSKEGRAYQDALGTAQLQDALKFGGDDVGKAGAFHFAGPNTKRHGAKTRKYEQDILRRYSGSKDTGGEELIDSAEGDDTLYGLPMNLRGNVDLAKSMIPEQSAEDLEYRKELAESLSPERRKQDKKDAFYEGLGKFAARLGSAKDKSLLGGLAETLGAGAGDIAESLNEDKKRIREMQRERSALANATRKEQMDAVAMGFDLTGKVAQLDQGIQAQKADAKYKEATLAIQQAQVNNELAKILADSKGKENTKERFIETFYNVLIRKGFSENQARQFAYIAAEKQLAKVEAEFGGKGGQGTLFQDNLDASKGTQDGAKQNPASKYQ